MIKVCCLVNLTIMVAGMVFLAILMFGHGGPNVIGILGIISVGFLSVVVGLSWFVVAKLTRVLTGLLSRNAGNFILYFLFQILLAIAIAVLVLAVVLVTCCIAGCLFAIPYLGTVLLLPILVFQRSYSIYYLAQYGSEYAVVSGQD